MLLASFPLTLSLSASLSFTLPLCAASVCAAVARAAAAVYAAVRVAAVRIAPIRATVVWRVLPLSPLLAATFLSRGSWFVQNGPRMWCFLDEEENVRIFSRNLPGVMLRRNEGDAAWAAGVRKKCHIRGPF